MPTERVLFHYKHDKQFSNTDTNAIGATTNETLRILETISGTTYYVRKFGQDYKVNGVTTATISTVRGSIGVNEWKFEFRGATTDTLFGTVTDNGSSTYVRGSNVATPEQLIIKLVWIMGTTAALAGGDDLSVISLLEDNDNPTTVTDEVGTHTVVLNGGAALNADQSKYGSTAGFCDNVDDSFEVADHADFNLGTGDFTIETWIRIPSGQTDDGSIFSKRPAATKKWIDVNYQYVDGINDQLELFIDSTGSWDIANNITLQEPVVYDTWQHLAITRSGNDFRAFIDGVQVWTDSSALGISVDATALHICQDGDFVGAYVNGFRVNKGTALYTSGFTPTATPLIPSGNDKLIINFVPNDTNVSELSAETLTGAGSIELYASKTGSTYYNSIMQHGGHRHTEAGTQAKPDFTYATAYARCSANDGVHFLDSQIYDETHTANQATVVTQSVLGQTLTITSGIGARVTREVSVQYNNSTAVYYNASGNDSNDGSWQSPKFTPAAAITARAGRSVIHGGTGATANDIFLITAPLTVPSYTFEADYGYTPTIRADSGFVGSSLITGGGSAFLRGIILDVNNFTNGAITNPRNVFDCTIKNTTTTGISNNTNLNNTFNCKKNLFQDCVIGISVKDSFSNTLTMDVSENIFDNCSSKGLEFFAEAGAPVFTGTFENCFFFDCNFGIHTKLTGGNVTITGVSINNNTFFNNTKGIFLEEVANTLTPPSTLTKCIFDSNTDHGIDSDVAVTITKNNFNNNGTDFNGNVTNNTPISGNPELSKTTTPYKLGLGAESVCFKADGSENDTGAILNNVLIQANNQSFNGIVFDGQNQYNNAIGTTGATDYNGMTVKWCTVKDYQGISIDLYSGAALDAEIDNNLVHNSGSGLKLSHGDNTIEENIFYKASKYNIHFDQSGQTINHNVSFGGKFNYYFDSNTSNIIFTNNITSGGGENGIFSAVSLAITFNCIDDPVTTSVDISASSNIQADPLFINTLDGTEDFHIKTIEGGFSFNSLCKDAGSSDIGAYAVDRAITSEHRRSYQLEHNPANLDQITQGLGITKSESALAEINLYAKGHKRIFPFEWDTNTISSETQTDILEYFSTLFSTNENELTKDQSVFRIHLIPETFLRTALNATVNASALTLTDTTLTVKENKYKGYRIGIKFISGTGSVISASAATLTDSGASWTVDEWIGYFIYYKKEFYTILSNTATVLTLSDPLSTLTDSASFDYSIDKYFEIASHEDTIFILKDPDSELIDGTYDYYIDFIEMKVTNNKFQPKPPGFNLTSRWSHARTGYKLTFQQK